MDGRGVDANGLRESNRDGYLKRVTEKKDCDDGPQKLVAPSSQGGQENER